MLFFDIETDTLLADCTKIHSLVIIDEVGTVFSYADQHGYTSIMYGLEKLMREDCLVAHNGISFDIPAIEKIAGYKYKGRVIDTLNLSRLVYPEIASLDIVKYKTLPKKLVGKHKLDAWGYRLGDNKIDFGKDFSKWTPDMQVYCIQDVKLLVKLYKFLIEKVASKDSLNLEMDFQKIIARQDRSGFSFNTEEATKLAAKLELEQKELEIQLKSYVQFTTKKELFTPKKDNATKGYIAGLPIVKVKQIPFNYTSRMQIIAYLKEKRGWVPVDFTDKKNPELGADILRSLPWPECDLFAKLFDVQKILGRLQDGDQSWLKHCKNGIVYGEMITNGAVTSRCTHKVIANIPRADKYLGKEVRSLFMPMNYQVGCDAKGLELRILAHYMAAYDHGAYAHEVCNGDVHTRNQQAAGLPTRDNAKTFIYGFLYGAGDPKIGSITNPTASLLEQKAIGKRLRTKFLSELPALDRLSRQVKDIAKSRGYLKGIDGRILPIRAQHAALNTLLQSCGAIVMKRACVIAWDLFDEAGLAYGRDVTQLIHYHDEMQFDCKDEETADVVGKLTTMAIQKAGEYYKLDCPLDGDYKIGKNWYECH
jgi:DNA polymerase I-like protein with 3'-5' exonuclease and polymerase domains